ncbi:MAG TPA: 30S ribosomal protein S6 [Polyangiaceae bacterium]|nr:30S ribosomal protein S6 [Polyangiaceae bacterium]
MAEAQAITSAREYETIYVLRPDAGREASETIGTRVLDVISKQHGSLTRVENWGYRKLAYPVRKHARGVYVYLKYVGDGALVSELERNLRLQDAVLKFQTVKIGKVATAEAPKPEDIEFEHLDVLEVAEPEESLAKTLGLEDVRDDYRTKEVPDTDEAEEEVPDLNSEDSE